MAIVLAVLIGAGLRLYRLPELMPFNGEIGRDLLISFLFIFYRQLVGLVGSSGLRGKDVCLPDAIFYRRISFIDQSTKWLEESNISPGFVNINWR